MVSIVRALASALLVIPLLLAAACGPSLVAVPPPELDEVMETLGYGLAPTRMPEGFEFEQFKVLEYGEPDEVMPLDEPPAQIVYRKLNHHIFIMYPQRMPPSGGDNFLFENLGLNWQRPEDAVAEVRVNGETAYLVQGTWSAETLAKLSRLDPDLAEFTPQWDYDIYLTLYFNFELHPDEEIGVMIRAMLYPADWITEKGIVEIAESFQRID